MVDGLDPYTRYYSESELTNLERETTGRYTGIGLVFAPPASEARVLFVLPGSPAEEAGIRTGDRIVAVEGELMDSLPPGGLQRRIAEKAPRSLALLLRSRSGEERLANVTPRELVDPTVRHESIVDPALGVAYVAIESFTRETPAELDAALQRLRAGGMRALIVDVRGNLGGVLGSAVAIANRFVRAGLIVSREGRGEVVRHEADPRKATWADLPLVVLVDGESASASEVFAAAVQEHRAAVVVGWATYGKGVVQNIRPFDGAAVRLTTAYYYTPSHRNLERTVERAWEAGLVPDLEIALSPVETRALRAFLARASPPEAARGEILAWEREEGIELLPPHPPDAQLDAALALFRGDRPGAHVARSRP